MRRVALLLSLALLGSCAAPTSESAASATVEGTATYRERMMLPPTAVLEVTLEDVSRADAPADVIARTQVQTLTAPPYSFTLTYDPARIKVGHHYTLRARINDGGTLMFESSSGYPLTGLGVVTRVHLELRRAGNEPRAAAPASRQMRGVYKYMADAGWFVDCATGVRLAVAQEGDNAALEGAFSKARKSWVDAPMLATVQGRVEERIPMEGRARPTLIVEKFMSVEPQGCSGPGSTAQLENTYWKLMTLNGKSAETPEGTREVHFVLNAQARRINGFGGCNGLSGMYRLEGEKLEFIDIATTMMACANDMEREMRFHEMLGRVARWKIAGETLQLADASGMVIATFESRYMK